MTNKILRVILSSIIHLCMKYPIYLALFSFRITYTCPVGYVIEVPNRDDEQPEFVPLLQETFDVMCGDDANWLPLAPGGGNAMPSCIRKIYEQHCKIKTSLDMRKEHVDWLETPNLIMCNIKH
jgi:hypothetical protein